MSSAKLSEREAIGGNKPPAGNIAEQLAKDYAALFDTVEALAKRATEAPAEIGSDDEHKIVAEIERAASVAYKNAEAQRVAEKAPYLNAGREVDGFFEQFTKRLDRIATALNKRIKVYLDAKAAAARKALAEEARLAREEQDRLFRQAQEAEAAKNEPLIQAALKASAEQENIAVAATKESLAKPADLARTRTDTGILSTLKTVWLHEVLDLQAIPLDQLKPYFTPAEVDKAIRGFIKAGRRELTGVRIYEDTEAVNR